MELKNAIILVTLAAQKLGVNPFELGCKFIFDELEKSNSLIDTAKEHADLLYDVYCDNYKLGFDEKVLKKNRIDYGIARQAEYDAKAYRRALQIVLKDYKKTADPGQLGLIKARAQVRAKKIREQKPLPEGARSFTVSDKIKMKSFKIMKFLPKDLYGKKVKDLANKINVLLVKPEDESQDDFRDRCNRIKETFNDLDKLASDMLASNKPYEVSAEQAKINNARQSQLTDAIQMHYGKTTEMMISVRHCVDDLFDDDVHKYLCYGDREKGMQKVNTLKTKLACIFVRNGINVKLLGKDARVLHYTFWTANNSQLKIGECYLLSDPSYVVARLAGMAGMTEEEFNKIPMTGSDALKYWSYASTPGCPMVDDDGNVITADDILVVDSVELKRVFKHVLVVDKNGKYSVMPEYEVSRTFNDGGAIAIGVPSQQFRGLFCEKGFLVRIGDKNGNMVDEIAAREGLKVPEFIKDCDGKMREWRKYKIITSVDTWKWKKYGLSWEEFKDRMNKLSQRIPGVNMMYTARLADSIEEDDRRKMARQATQQWANATAEQISRLIATDVNKLKKLTTLPGIIKKFAGLEKDEKDRTAFEHLIEVCPEILAHPLYKEKVKEMFDAQFANAAMRPAVHGCYPYIAEDPVATIKIWIFGMDPNQIGLGYLKENEINIPNCEEQRKLYFVRYPANHLVGMVRVNHNDPIYRHCGNVALLSIDGDTIVRADGDFDGDEASIVWDEIVVELTEQVDQWSKRPLIVFPHEKAEAKIVTNPMQRAMMISNSIVIANKFGGAVGQNSNLATKCFESAAKAKTTKERGKDLLNACWAHIGAILAIDLAKTGKMPAWLKSKLDDLMMSYGTMPWNQRFAKHTVSMPWHDNIWNELTQDESESTPNRIPRAIMDILGIDCPKVVVEDEMGQYRSAIPAKLLDIDFGNMKLDENLLTANVKNHSTATIIDIATFRSIESRNYRTASDETDGDNEIKLITDIKAGKEISPAELFRFIWRNRASLVYKTNTNSDKIGNAQMVEGYYEWCHDLMFSIGKNGTNKLFTKMSEEDQHKAIVNKFIKLALASENGIGKTIGKGKKEEELTELEKHEKLIRKSSFFDFTLKVFAYELYQNVCDKKGIKNRWVKPVDAPEESEDDIDPVAAEAFC